MIWQVNCRRRCSINIRFESMLPKIDLRFLICNIHKTSARLRFLCFEDKHSLHGVGGYVCAPKPLPTLVSVLDAPPSGSLSMHPSMGLKQLRDEITSKSCDLRTRKLEIVPNFRVWIEAPRQAIALYLVADIHEEPFDPPENGNWIELPNSWHLSAFERDLLREAYTYLLG